MSAIGFPLDGAKIGTGRGGQVRLWITRPVIEFQGELPRCLRPRILVEVHRSIRRVQQSVLGRTILRIDGYSHARGTEEECSIDSEWFAEATLESMRYVLKVSSTADSRSESRELVTS
jgi:hypothetical protein